jgi:hypothetical protein
MVSTMRAATGLANVSMRYRVRPWRRGGATTMAQLIVGAVRRAPLFKAPRRWWRERMFFSGMAITFSGVVFVGFAPTYYLKSLYSTSALTPLVHLHGALFSAWILLLLVQTGLVAARRTDLHRRLGAAGGALVLAMLVTGYLVAMNAGRRGTSAPGALVPGTLQFLIVPLGGLVVFPALVVAALLLRGRVDFHKRLMLIGTIELLNAAVDRLPGVTANGLAPF